LTSAVAVWAEEIERIKTDQGLVDIGGSGRIRKRSGSTTEKFPGQSLRWDRIDALTAPILDGGGAGKRKSTTPQPAGRLNR
jgi:hypothetical protein